MNFFLLKNIHIVSVTVSFALLFIRGLWQLRSFPPAQERWVKTLPHVVDTLLVVSAVGLLWMQKSGAADWMMAKLLAVTLYVVLIVYFVRFAKTFIQKLAVWVFALADLLFITSIAVLQNPRGILSLI